MDMIQYKNNLRKRNETKKKFHEQREVKEKSRIICEKILASEIYKNSNLYLLLLSRSKRGGY